MSDDRDVLARLIEHGCWVEDEDTGRLLICRACSDRLDRDRAAVAEAARAEGWDRGWQAQEDYADGVVDASRNPYRALTSQPAAARAAKCEHCGLGLTPDGRCQWCDDRPAAARCTCTPCGSPQWGAPGIAHCAACCGGTGIEDYDDNCPDAEHREWANRQHGQPAAARTCGCRTCHDPAQGVFMIVCPDCGNKRCPKATHHENACTGSNEPGQQGSVYGGLERQLGTTGNATARTEGGGE